MEIEEKIMRSWDVSHVEDNLDSWSIWLEFLKGTFWVIKWNTFFWQGSNLMQVYGYFLRDFPEKKVYLFLGW